MIYLIQSNEVPSLASCTQSECLEASAFITAIEGLPAQSNQQQATYKRALLGSAPFLLALSVDNTYDLQLNKQIC